MVVPVYTTVEPVPLLNTPEALVVRGVPVPVMVRVYEPVPRLKVVRLPILRDVSFKLFVIVAVPVPEVATTPMSLRTGMMLASDMFWAVPFNVKAELLEDLVNVAAFVIEKLPAIFRAKVDWLNEPELP